jgi:hypothetical protein
MDELRRMGQQQQQATQKAGEGMLTETTTRTTSLDRVETHQYVGS